MRKSESTLANFFPYLRSHAFLRRKSRSSAGLEVLEQLSRRTQVLFFSHHRHLVEIARTAFDASCHIIDLGSEETVRKAA